MPSFRPSLFLMLAAAAVPEYVGAQATHDITETPWSFDGVVYNDCTGEDIQLHVEGTDTIRYTVSPSGRTSREYHYFYKSRAVGLRTGAKYVGHDIYNDNDVFTDDFQSPAVYDFKGHGFFNGQGKLPNSRYVYSRRVTINANGKVTHLSDSFSEFTCE